MSADEGRADQVGKRQRLLDRQIVVPGEALQDRDGPLRAPPALIGVGVDVDIGGHDIERGAENRELREEIVAVPSLGQHRIADLDLEPLEALLDAFDASRRHRLRRLVIEVGQHLELGPIRAAQERIDRHVERLAGEIVDRHVDAGARATAPRHAARDLKPP